MEVVTFATQDRMGAHLDVDVEITGPGADRAGVSTLRHAEARPIHDPGRDANGDHLRFQPAALAGADRTRPKSLAPGSTTRDRKSTRLNASHLVISYAVFC